MAGSIGDAVATEVDAHGSAAPTFGRVEFHSVAMHNRPKVGATRGATLFAQGYN